MWFQVSLVPGRPPLSVLISTNGSLFFKADDFGNFLGYKNPVNFAFRNASLVVKHVLPTLALPSLHSCRLLTLSEVLSFLKKRNRFYRFECKHFEGLWMNSAIESYTPIIHSPTPDAGPTVKAVPFNGVISLQRWISDFKKAVLLDYRRKLEFLDDPLPKAIVDRVLRLEEEVSHRLQSSERLLLPDSTVQTTGRDTPRRPSSGERTISSDRTQEYDWPEGNMVVATTTPTYQMTHTETVPSVKPIKCEILLDNFDDHVILELNFVKK